ncbi:hypothetical protein R1sor_011357 [Riccia sorocarpa]|uniref:Uncharacterized protein n=1 Tax=Riccia sorocarpa TaxID=122646 RepID=A0ABD3I1T6_9MARC
MEATTEEYYPDVADDYRIELIPKGKYAVKCYSMMQEERNPKTGMPRIEEFEGLKKWKLSKVFYPWKDYTMGFLPERNSEGEEIPFNQGEKISNRARRWREAKHAKQKFLLEKNMYRIEVPPTSKYLNRYPGEKTPLEWKQPKEGKRIMNDRRRVYKKEASKVFYAWKDYALSLERTRYPFTYNPAKGKKKVSNQDSCYDNGLQRSKETRVSNRRSLWEKYYYGTGEPSASLYPDVDLYNISVIDMSEEHASDDDTLEGIMQHVPIKLMNRNGEDVNGYSIRILPETDQPDDVNVMMGECAPERHPDGCYSSGINIEGTRSGTITIHDARIQRKWIQQRDYRKFINHKEFPSFWRIPDIMETANLKNNQVPNDRIADRIVNCFAVSYETNRRTTRGRKRSINTVESMSNPNQDLVEMVWIENFDEVLASATRGVVQAHPVRPIHSSVEKRLVFDIESERELSREARSEGINNQGGKITVNKEVDSTPKGRDSEPEGDSTSKGRDRIGGGAVVQPNSQFVTVAEQLAEQTITMARKPVHKKKEAAELNQNYKVIFGHEAIPGRRVYNCYLKDLVVTDWADEDEAILWLQQFGALQTMNLSHIAPKLITEMTNSFNGLTNRSDKTNATYDHPEQNTHILNEDLVADVWQIPNEGIKPPRNPKLDLGWLQEAYPDYASGKKQKEYYSAARCEHPEWREKIAWVLCYVLARAEGREVSKGVRRREEEPLQTPVKPSGKKPVTPAKKTKADKKKPEESPSQRTRAAKRKLAEDSQDGRRNRRRKVQIEVEESEDQDETEETTDPEETDPSDEEPGESLHSGTDETSESSEESGSEEEEGEVTPPYRQVTPPSVPSEDSVEKQERVRNFGGRLLDTVTTSSEKDTGGPPRFGSILHALGEAGELKRSERIPDTFVPTDSSSDPDHNKRQFKRRGEEAVTIVSKARKQSQGSDRLKKRLKHGEKPQKTLLGDPTRHASAQTSEEGTTELEKVKVNPVQEAARPKINPVDAIMKAVVPKPMDVFKDDQSNL